MKAIKYIFLMLIACVGYAQAEIVKEVVKVPVSVKEMFSTTTLQMHMVVWRDTEKTNTPFLIINHGRSSGYDMMMIDKKTGEPGVAYFANLSKYFVKLGFTVVVPTRPGFGATGGGDYEDTRIGVFDSIADHLANVGEVAVKYTRALPYVNPDKGIVMGASMGGAMVVSMGARNIPGVVGYMNFSGGMGGLQGGGMKNGHNVNNLYAEMGKVTKTPSIWVYGDKDELYDDKPVEWFENFKKGGSNTRMVVLKDVGHATFGARKLWEKDVKEFLKDRNVI